MVIVVLTLVITCSVSFTYSSSEAAHAVVTGKSTSAGATTIPAARDNKSRRRVQDKGPVAALVVVVGVGGKSFDLNGVSGLGVAVVGVSRAAGEAMVGRGGKKREGEEREKAFVFLCNCTKKKKNRGKWK